MSAERAPEVAPEATADPCVVCGHELWCHKREAGQPVAWNCNGHGPVCERFASTAAAAEAKVLVERALDQPPLIASRLADQVAPDQVAPDQVAPDPRTLADYIPCPKPVTYSTDRSLSPCARCALRFDTAARCADCPAPVPKPRRAPIVEPCRASWAEFVCDMPAGHKGKHHTFDGAHSWYQTDVPGLEPDAATRRVKLEEMADSNHEAPAAREYQLDVTTWKPRPGEPMPQPVGAAEWQRLYDQASRMSKPSNGYREWAAEMEAKQTARKVPPVASGSTPPTPAPLHRLGEVPRALRALASQIAFGSSKPGRTVGDWRPAYSSAQGRSVLIDKILRHALALAAGELLDEDGRPHAAAVLANTSFLLELEGGS